MKLTSLSTISLVFLLFSCNDNGNNSIVSQETPQKLATVTTNPVTGISAVNAYTGGDVSDDGGSAIKERGVCYSTKKDPTISDSRQIAVNGARIFFNYLSDLKPGTLYYLRAYATTNAGTAYGASETFKTLNENIETGTVTDRDGNIYVTVKIGDQWWMAENLKTTRYRTGEKISEVENQEDWNSKQSGAFCSVKFKKENVSNRVGYLYNNEAVNDSRNLAPEGWHIPTSTEWENLINSLGGEKEAGIKLFMDSKDGWLFDLTNLNSSGFSARSFDGIDRLGFFSENVAFCGTGNYGLGTSMWTSTLNEYEENKTVSIGYIVTRVFNEFSPSLGLPIRCIKD
ncbi:MAG: fibrobacter succinogenes major paralogous domain-containing protein [Bacteroidetes bacterium]|nr:fibrobacter succinogenes major paralogous domain-containing protein [Bacteroidota bacterium]